MSTSYIFDNAKVFPFYVCLHSYMILKAWRNLFGQVRVTIIVYYSTISTMVIFKFLHFETKSN